MKPKRVILFLTLVLVLVGGGLASASHSYLLTVQQLRDGLQKANAPQNKGFFLVDVRTAEEYFSGVIPGTDMNIDYRSIKERHREIGAGLEDHIVVYCQSGSNLPVLFAGGCPHETATCHLGADSCARARRALEPIENPVLW